MGNILQVPVPNGTAKVAWGSREAGVNSLLFINQDLNNTVWLGQVSNVTANGPNSIPLGPNGTFSGDAQSNWYVVGAASGISPIVVVPNGQAYFLGITQGLGNLVIPSVQSPNFVTGVSGWQIGKNGHAEFNDITIRGGITIGGNDYYYSTPTPQANTLVASIGAGGLDSAGNLALAGIVTYFHGSVYFALQHNAGVFDAYTASTEAGPWTLVSGLNFATQVGGSYAIVPDVPILVDQWNNMSLLNSWSLGGGGYAQYKLEPNNRVSVRGANVIPGTVTGGTSIWTPGAGYVPTVTQRVEMIVENSTGSAIVDTPRFDVVAGGMQVANVPGSTTRVGWNGSYALD